MPINVTVLTGRLTRDPELRRTTSGKSVANFTIAVDNVTGKDQEKSASFFNVVAWDKLADTIEQYVKKGHKVGVTGRLAQRTYEKDDGTRVNVVEVIATEVEFLTPKAEADGDAEAEEDEDEEPAPKVEPIRKPAGKPAYVKPTAQPASTAKKKIARPQVEDDPDEDELPF